MCKKRKIRRKIEKQLKKILSKNTLELDKLKHDICFDENQSVESNEIEKLIGTFM